MGQAKLFPLELCPAAFQRHFVYNTMRWNNCKQGLIQHCSSGINAHACDGYRANGNEYAYARDDNAYAHAVPEL